MSDLNRRVKLNVGGSLFETTMGTLKRVADSTLARLVDESVESDHEPVFLDHDSRYFGYVLNYLRDGRVALPDDVTQIDEIKREAEVLNEPQR